MSAFSYDCSKCAAFCCIALGFEKGAKFAHEKPKNERCQNLDDCDRCTIHADLEDKGYHGCIDFDCHGAGMHIMSVYKNVNWRDDPERTLEVYDKFFFLKTIFQLVHATEIAFKNKGINSKSLIKSFFKLVSTHQKIPVISDQAACDKMTAQWENLMKRFLMKQIKK